MGNRWQRPEPRKNSAETVPASRVRAPTGGVIKKSGASDSAGAPCHGHAGQGQATARPEGSRRPHFEDVCVLSQWVSETRRSPTEDDEMHPACQSPARAKKISACAIDGLIVAVACMGRLFAAVSAEARFAGWARSILPHHVAICVGFGCRCRAAA
jgi:hypothetical protein